MKAVGSSKLISNREVFNIVLMTHQGGIFWLLPYFIVKENGSFGLTALIPGLVVGLVIISICTFWGRRCRELDFLTSLTMLLGKPLGKIVGACFVLFYIVFTIICLCSFVEMINGQLLLETPRLVILCTIFLLIGWLSYNGLEDITRMVVLCMVLMCFMMFLILAGSFEVFSVENALPFQMGDPVLFQEAVYHSVFAYSGLLILFMVYPALNTERRITRQLFIAMFLSTAMVAMWVVLALGVFGNCSVDSLVWLPLELARMVQIGPFLERTEIIFSVLWMAIIFVNGSLLMWCASESVHQLFGKTKNTKIHWGVVLFLLIASSFIKNIYLLFRAEQIMSLVSVWFVPILLLLIFVGTLLRKKKEVQQK